MALAGICKKQQYLGYAFLNCARVGLHDANKSLFLKPRMDLIAHLNNGLVMSAGGPLFSGTFSNRASRQQQ